MIKINSYFHVFFCNIDCPKKMNRDTPLPCNGRSAFTAANSNLQLLDRYRRLPTLCVQGSSLQMVVFTPPVSAASLFHHRIVSEAGLSFFKSVPNVWSASLCPPFTNSSTIEFHRKVTQTHGSPRLKTRILMSYS